MHLPYRMVYCQASTTKHLWCSSVVSSLTAQVGPFSVHPSHAVPERMVVRFTVHGNYFNPYAAGSSKTRPLKLSMQLELLGVASAVVGLNHV